MVAWRSFLASASILVSRRESQMGASDRNVNSTKTRLLMEGKQNSTAAARRFGGKPSRRAACAAAAVVLLPGAMSFARVGLATVVHSPLVTRGMSSGGPASTSWLLARRATRSNGGSRGIAMVGGVETSSGTTYDFTKQATRFETSFGNGGDADATGVIPITILTNKAGFEEWLGAQPPSAKSLIKALGNDSHKPGRMVLVPSSNSDSEISLSEVAFCLGEEGGIDSPLPPFALCSLREQLPPGKYSLRGAGGGAVSNPDAVALSWALGGYSFTRYKGNGNSKGKESGEEGGEEEAATKILVWPVGADKAKVSAAAASTFLVRDLITTPCEDMGPQHLEAVLRSLAEEFGGTARVVKGDDLLKSGDSYPMIHAVGRAAGLGREPRLLDLKWTPAGFDEDSLPKVTLVGKGVCFDTGGLDIKPAAGMLTMKKDMGGGAQVLGLARMIMSQQLPVRLRVLVPAVENSISGDAFRPGDVIISRNGKSTEIGNTDAEGRLVLADALVDASSEMPDLLIDCATLTGAARVALGTEVPVIFCNDDGVAEKLHRISGDVHDQVWRLPLWEGYRKQLSSKIADLKNVGTGGYGGAITAALYLDEFVGTKKDTPEGEEGGSREQKVPWIHMDFMAFNQASRAGRPEGGEAQGMRALYSLLEVMFMSK